MKKTLPLPTTPTTSVLLDLPAESFEDALVVVCVMLSPIMDDIVGAVARVNGQATDELAKFDPAS
jgi:hypothetical protein